MPSCVHGEGSKPRESALEWVGAFLLCFRGGGRGVWPCVGMREGMLCGGEGFIYYVCPFKDSKPI